MLEANANPERRFFIDLIIRDISLEDAILDMIDNAVDSLVRTKSIDIYKDLLQTGQQEPASPLASVKIKFSTKQFKIEDNCGGISFESAQNEVFRFGHPDRKRRASLSVFGIGMKRALFKIGRKIHIESHAEESGFIMDLDVDDWVTKETVDWKIPIEHSDGESDPVKRGTKITINRLREEVGILTENPIFQNRLIKAIQESYPFYLEKYFDVTCNDKPIPATDLSFGESEHIRPAIDSWTDGVVNATLICGLLPRENGLWTYENSGWYILCNGRVIVHADKSKLTGWGDPLPLFMPKNRGFLGIVFLESSSPEDLPWNTQKRGINTESPVYIRALKRMIPSARVVIQHQNKMYESSDSSETKEEYRDSVKSLQTASATKEAAGRISTPTAQQRQAFIFSAPVSTPKTTSIQFRVKVEDLARVKKRLGRTYLSNKDVGERIFKYFLDRECGQ